MRWSLKLGQIVGIGLLVHWTFFLLLAWIARIGRVLMARDRDTADAAITTTFGASQSESFEVWTNDVF